MSNKKFTWSVVLVILALITGFLAGNFISSKTITRKFFLNTGNKLDIIIDIINEQYVDTINIKDLVENSITKIFNELDPHSNYIPAYALETVNENIEGRFAGIGINTFLYRILNAQHELFTLC